MKPFFTPLLPTLMSGGLGSRAIRRDGRRGATGVRPVFSSIIFGVFKMSFYSRELETYSEKENM